MPHERLWFILCFSCQDLRLEGLIKVFIFYACLRTDFHIFDTLVLNVIAGNGEFVYTCIEVCGPLYLSFRVPFLSVRLFPVFLSQSLSICFKYIEDQVAFSCSVPCLIL